jgi:uncharacterized protein with GYD domain
MPTYISLINWTDQGIRNFQDTLKRAEAVGEIARSLGGQMRDLYWTLGPYDAVMISEFPDDEAATAFGLKGGSLGNIRTCTLRSFNRDELRPIIERATAAG